MALKYFEKLSNNYLELLNDEKDFNIAINVGESPNTKKFRAHSAILKCRSLYFCNELTELTNIDKDKNHIITLDLKNVSIQQFEVLIKYIYGGIVLLEEHDASFIFELMLVTYEFLFDELAKQLQDHLIEKEAHWLHLNFNRVYLKSFQNNKLQNLQEWCNNIIIKNHINIFDSEEFFTLQENALASLISRDDLQMEEIKIWNYVIKWGIAKNPGLPSELEDWSYENFIALKTTLQNCLPHIRYFQMSGIDIINNVQPYQQIFEKNLWKDIMKKYMTNEPISSIILPPRSILKPALPTRIADQFSKVINVTEIALCWAVDILPDFMSFIFKTIIPTIIIAIATFLLPTTIVTILIIIVTIAIFLLNRKMQKTNIHIFDIIALILIIIVAIEPFSSK
ncbi:hypothetical protein C2G38_2141291 [Gigaspora rosea]|uniref:BTB domain-containing protein n=1 Tax=Gigaspora rosea TaxID=44941 RepID=A0A397VCI9_9GLOM|nr:hypothetical protein C2G38_2141291 [Gigaspora rosea]